MKFSRILVALFLATYSFGCAHRERLEDTISEPATVIENQSVETHSASAVIASPTRHRDEEKSLEAIRARAMADVFVLKDYRPGKNSFVENAERHPGAWTGKGFRYTLLDATGPGSIRHIWTTRGEGEPNLTWEFYIDGEKTPSLSATDEELRKAMERYPISIAPANSVPYGNRDFNFFLPIPFDQSIRIDVVQRVDSFWLWFCQIDYRLEDDSMQGARLYGYHDGDGLRVAYAGLGEQKAELHEGEMETVRFSALRLAPMQEERLGRIEGPAIARELRLQWSAGANLRLMACYDSEESFAIDAPIERFFGPFQSASLYRHGPGDASCYLPMPIRESCELWIRNEGNEEAEIHGEAVVERVHGFSPSWGYLHARYARTEQTDGHRLHQVAYIRGRGQFLGMTLYNTGHDHGGGDFAVVDGESARPAFLHGVNGEDYFTFAWFGKGAHHPYAVAHSNEEGRYRHHFENPYPFQHSFSMEWGAFPGLSPESVCWWYQAEPCDGTLADGARDESVAWDVFGPVPIAQHEDGTSMGDLYAGLPTVKALDAGGKFDTREVEQHATVGWKTQWTTGPSLNLTYIGRPEIEINPENELGGMGHAFLARRTIHSRAQREVEYALTHDDPMELWVNGERVYHEGLQLNGFETRKVQVTLKPGENEIVARLTNYFNRTFNWAGFAMWPTAP
ncbi:MAG: DUF2961 domain-containing protein [bacterium]|nr:DUF2961 domain-containing protein [bacterium]